MIKVDSIEKFINDEGLDINDTEKVSVSVRLNKNKIKYVKYLAYKTGKSYSEIIDNFFNVSGDEFSDNYGCLSICDTEIYATTNNLDTYK